MDENKQASSMARGMVAVQTEEWYGLKAEVSRLQKIISEPVASFGTSELITWADKLQEIIAEYPEEERGDIPFVMTMGAHLEKFVKAWNSPTIREKDARIA